MAVCACGCGGIAVNKYVHGHNSRVAHPMKGRKHTEETRRKLSESHIGLPSGAKGYKHSEESRKKMSAAHKGIPLSAEHNRNAHTARMKNGYRHSEETRRKISETEKGKVVSEETKKRISKSKMGKRLSTSTEFKKGGTPWMKGKKHNDESILKNIEANKNRVTEEMRKQTSERMRALWRNPEHAKKCLSCNSPNKQEVRLLGILDRLFPSEWKFVGNGQLLISGKCPDFVNVNGQKKIIELFGTFWHKGENTQDRVDVFTPFGYETLVIWEKELSNKNKLELKLREFCGGADGR